MNIGAIKVLIHNEVNARFTKTNTNIKTVSRSVEETRKDLEDTKGKVDNVSGNLDSINKDIINIKDSISNIEEIAGDETTPTPTTYTLENPNSTSKLLVNEVKNLIIS